MTANGSKYRKYACGNGFSVIWTGTADRPPHKEQPQREKDGQARLVEGAKKEDQDTDDGGAGDEGEEPFFGAGRALILRRRRRSRPAVSQRATVKAAPDRIGITRCKLRV